MARLTKPFYFKPALYCIPSKVMTMNADFSSAFLAFFRARYSPGLNRVPERPIRFILLRSFRLLVILLPALLISIGLPFDFLLFVVDMLPCRVVAFPGKRPKINTKTFLARWIVARRSALVFTEIIKRFFDFAAPAAEHGTVWFRQGVLLNRALSYDSCIHASGCRSFYFNTARSNA